MNHRIIRRYEYHQWANHRILKHLNKLPDEVYNFNIKSIFPSISVVIEHIYQTDGMWLSVMSGDSFETTMDIINRLQEESEGTTLEEMPKLYDELSEQYLDFFEEQQDLDNEIEIEHPKFGTMTSAISELIEHVVNHGTYHRGNIAAMLRQQEYAGVPSDYIFYLYNVGKEG